MSLIVCCASFLGVVAVTEFYFYSRFILALIVPSVLLVAAAMDLGVRWAATHWDRGLQAGKLGLMVVAFLVLLHWIPLQLQVVPMIHYLQRTPFAPLRETAAALRDARAGGAAIFGYGFGAEALQYYLPDLSYSATCPRGRHSKQQCATPTPPENHSLLPSATKRSTARTFRTASPSLMTSPSFASTRNATASNPSSLTES